MKTYQEESRKDRVNTGGKPGNDKVKGGIEPLEVEAFKRRIKEGDRLYCYRPRRKGDEEAILEKMSVIKPYEHIVTMAYHGVRGNVYETSMTWGEAIRLNRMTQKQLEREIRSMRKEMGIPCSNDSGPKGEKAPGRRHDEAVEEIRKQRMLEQLERDKEANEEAARKMGEKYPGAEAVLEEIRDKYEYQNEDYMMIVPRRLIDIAAEGNALHHCAGSSERYYERIMHRETYICFLRRRTEPEVPYYTIEVEPGGTIRQHRSHFDEEPGIEEIRGFLREWQKVIRKRLTEEDHRLARESEIKRQKNIDELKEKNNTRVLKGLEEDFMEAV